MPESSQKEMRKLAVLVGLLWLAPLPARADDGFRCGNGRLVSVGDGMKQVRDRVGNVEESVVEEREVDVLLDEWTYDLGPGAFIRYVTFESGRVIGIATGDYGRK